MIEKNFEAFTNKNEMSDEEVDDILDVGVRRAQEIARTQGLEIGQTVAHPNDDMAYALKEVVEDVAFVWVPDQENTVKKFPLNELFDPSTAKREAVQETATRETKKHPEITN
ncbi:hypothetical protein KKA27_02370 [Patescibacteria group bacterium]|nr:hypothetical protein [Patescibacteria group bacterium]MBU2633600.1 hypothetical protein [Patescibacteria group bacterium]